MTSWRSAVRVSYIPPFFLEEAMPPSVNQIRASLTVLLAKAVKDLFPKMELIKGRVTDHGFVYDILTGDQEIDSHALGRLEERMLELLREGVVIKNVQMLRDNAVDYFEHQGEYIKAALVSRAKTELLDLIQVGDMLDQVDHTGIIDVSDLKFFRLVKCVGVRKNYPSTGEAEVLQIIGTAFLSKKELKYYLKRLDSAQYLDSLQLGQKLKLFYFDEGVYWLDRGLIVKQAISRIVEELYRQEKFEFIKIPSVVADGADLIAKLFVQSVVEGGRIAEISYKEIDQFDFDAMGLWRSPYYFADQSYLYVKDQDLHQALISSLQRIVKIVNMFCSGERWVVCRLEPGAAKRLFGYEKVLAALTDALNVSGIDYIFEEVGVEYSGPRAYLCLPDMYGKYWKCSYVGVNLRALSQYEAKKGKREARELMQLVEASMCGSFDRIIAYLLELHQGRLPFRLAPEQVRVISQRETSHEYAEMIASRMREQGLRVGVDLTDGKLGGKIHRAESEYVHTIVVVGDQEVRNQTIALRSKTADEKMLNMKLESFLEELY